MPEKKASTDYPILSIVLVTLGGREFYF